MKKPSGLSIASWMFGFAVLAAACAGSEVNGGSGSGGSNSSAGNGGPGAGGSSTQGAGGSSTQGAGGSSSQGAGGSSSQGAGGSSTQGAGGSSSQGAGGSSSQGAGGSSAGAGGSSTAGSAGASGATGRGGTTGSAGAGGTTGTAGATGRGGAGGTGGTAGAAGATGRGGTTGSAGASGTTGTGGSGPAPTEVFVAPDGNDSNPGTMAMPLKSICDTTAKAGACYKLCPSSYSCPAAGATIWMRGGTYTISGSSKIDIGAIRAGASATATMNIFAYNGEKPVIDAMGLTAGNTTGIAMHIKGSYWHVKGIEIKNAPYNCIKIEGGGNTIENTVVHACGNTGLTISQYAGEDMSVGPPGSNNLILNVDSYNNIATNGDGEDSDGFGAKKAGGTGNVFRGCRAWYNADDGFDVYGWTDPVTFDNCWAIDSNRRNAPNGDGNGFKMGKGPGNHKLSNTLAVNNTKFGYTDNGADNTSNCTNCRGCGNGSGLNDSGSRALSGSVTNLSPCPSVTALEAARKADGSLPSF